MFRYCSGCDTSKHENAFYNTRGLKCNICCNVENYKSYHKLNTIEEARDALIEMYENRIIKLESNQKKIKEDIKKCKFWIDQLSINKFPKTP